VETSEVKTKASVFWDGEGILLGEFFERDAVMNCERHEQTLNKLQQRIRKVRPKREMSEVLIPPAVPIQHHPTAIFLTP
jgi:hypothetical protein